MSSSATAATLEPRNLVGGNGWCRRRARWMPTVCGLPEFATLYFTMKSRAFALALTASWVHVSLAEVLVSSDADVIWRFRQSKRCWSRSFEPENRTTSSRFFCENLKLWMNIGRTYQRSRRKNVSCWHVDRHPRRRVALHHRSVVLH